MTDFRTDAAPLPSRTADPAAAAPGGLPSVSVEAAFDDSLHILEQRLRRSPGPVRPYASYLADSKGKNIRARSLILAASDDKGQVSKSASSVAAAIELLHLATLVHDDVMDEADYRRGRETLQKKAGARIAVITGDYLMADVLILTAEAAEAGGHQDLASPAFLTRYMKRIASGELLQTIQIGNFGMNVSDYLRIISGKTAALFEASFYAGALLLTEDRREHSLYRKLGRYIGMIFQLTDDCLDYESTLPDTGKNVQSDYEQQVVTLPLIYALEEDPALKAAVTDSRTGAAEVYERVRASSSLRRVRHLAHKYRSKADTVIGRLACGPVKKDRLRRIVAQAYREIE